MEVYTQRDAYWTQEKWNCSPRKPAKQIESAHISNHFEILRTKVFPVYKFDELKDKKE